MVEIDPEPALPQHNAEGHKKYRTELESKLNGTFSSSTVSHLQACSENYKAIEVFRLSVLTYLCRLTDTVNNDKSMKVDGWISKAFDILSDLDTLRYPFPLFVFGCEARTDEQRRTIIELIAKTEEKIPIRAMAHVKSITRSAWVHDDLMDNTRDEAIGYMDKVNSLISSHVMLPVLI